MLRRTLSLPLLVFAIVVLLATFHAPISAQEPEAPRVTLSSGGMEELHEVQVQIHVAGATDWRKLAGVDEAGLKAKVEKMLRATPGLTVVEGKGDSRTPRLLVIVVGHMIADPQGNTDTSATDLQVSLNQPVIVHRPTPSGKPILATGATWSRNILITGLNSSMRERVDQKLTYLIEQFKDEYARSNPAAPPSG
jgi:hypothetical protein